MFQKSQPEDFFNDITPVAAIQSLQDDSPLSSESALGLQDQLSALDDRGTRQAAWSFVRLQIDHKLSLRRLSSIPATIWAQLCHLTWRGSVV